MNLMRDGYGAKGLCLSAPQKKINRVQPTEKQPLKAIFSVIDGLIFIIFFNRENFEQATLNIQIWVGLLHNIKLQKCYFLRLFALSPEIQY